MKYPKYERFGRLRKYLQEVSGMRHLKAERDLWTVLDPICKASSSTGCTFHEMYLIYSHILRNKPAYVLELGPGVSTIVMGYAAKKLRTSGYACQVVAMDDILFYYEDLKKLLPAELNDCVQLILSPVEDREVNGFIARRYVNKPQHEYGLVFIDGPEIPSQKEDPRYLDGDILDVAEWNKKPFTAYLDCRIGTRDALKVLMPRATIHWDKQHKLSRIEFSSEP